MGFVNST